MKQLDGRMQELGAKLDFAPLFASHPIYQYMARRYSLNLKMMMWEPDADPGEEQWLYFKSLLKEHTAGWMIWESEPLADSAARLQTLQVRNLVFSPCFARPAQGDFISVMMGNIDRVERSSAR